MAKRGPVNPRTIDPPTPAPPLPAPRAHEPAEPAVSTTQGEMGGRGGGEGSGFGTYGISGLARYGAISRVYEEFLRELQGPAGMKSYREMQDNDPITGAILFAANHLCRKVSFKFQPANGSREADAVADFVGGAIFDDMEMSWPDTVSEILTMLSFGWAVMEFRMKRRLGLGDPTRLGPATLPTYDMWGGEGIGLPSPAQAPSRFTDGKVGFRSWSLRSQESLFMWEFDEDSRATVMQQMAPPDYRIRRVPLPKCLHFRTQVAKNNPEGRSILRNAWIPYYMKKNLQVFEGIGVEREMAGYPMIQIKEPDVTKGQVVPDVWNPRDPQMVTLLAALQRIVRSVRQDEQMGLVMPWWADFKLVSTGSRRRSETNDIIGRYDQRIAMSMMADFIMLGHEAVGSKALASTKISLFTAALSSFLDTACSIIDRQAVTTLLAFNGIPQALAPTLKHGDVESVNLTELGALIKDLAGTGFNPLAGEDAQRAVMEAAKLPTAGMPTQDVLGIQAEVRAAGQGGQGGGAAGGNGRAPKGKPASGKPNGNGNGGGKPGDESAGDDPGNHPPVMPEGASMGPPSMLETT